MLILASSSPRRRHLLEALGVRFEVVPSHVDEREPLPGEEPAAYVRELACRKAAEVARRHPKDVVLAADTDVALDGTILGKPVDPEDALRMLGLLRGREHEVTTAVVVRCGNHERVEHVTSRVAMRAFSDEEAERYIASGEPMDKAGAYAVQEFGGSFVDQVEGCYNAVVGLPLCLASRMLHMCGLEVQVPESSACRACGTSCG